MENSYVLCTLLGFGFGLFLTLLSPIEYKFNTRKGFNTIQPMIKSDVDSIKSTNTNKHAEDYSNNEKERR